MKFELVEQHPPAEAYTAKGCPRRAWELRRGGVRCGTIMDKTTCDEITQALVSVDYPDDVLALECDYVGAAERFQAAMRLAHGAFGLADEAGEFAGAIKAHVFYGRPLDLVNLKEELGDMFWYLALICDEMDINFADVMEANSRKLHTRYPGKFSSQAANNRDLAKEREALEGKDVASDKA